MTTEEGAELNVHTSVKSIITAPSLCLSTLLPQSSLEWSLTGIPHIIRTVHVIEKKPMYNSEIS